MAPYKSHKQTPLILGIRKIPENFSELEGWLVVDLAKATGVGRRRVLQWEFGTGHRLDRICHTCGVQVPGSSFVLDNGNISHHCRPCRSTKKHISRYIELTSTAAVWATKPMG